MKLVELLVKELVKWPECVTYFVQDGDGDVKAGSGSKLREPLTSRMWIRGTALDSYNFYSDLCTDWKTSVVTKDVYAKHKTQMKRKVREDFDPEKRYNVNVSGCTEDVKKEVQQAFFDIGYKWWDFGETYQHLDVLVYSNSNRDGIPRLLGWNKRPMENSITVEEFLDLVYEPEKKGHVHAELMAQYAEDAKTHSDPWKLWQVKADDGAWWDCDAHPRWANDTEYRRKPKTKLIHGVEVPVFEFTPKVGEKYYTANVGLPELYGCGHKSSEYCTFTQRMSERGLLYPFTEEGKQSAILLSKIMLGIA